MSNFRSIRGVQVPTFLYGTAWKEERTTELTAKALKAGFLGIDTANQRKHYFEAAVGDAITDSGIPRAELFLQTKFTYQRGQDHRLPYDPDASLTEQVTQSFASSLEHLHTDYLDSYVLHGPATAHGISEHDWEVWRAMEQLHRDGKTRLIGVSNISFEQLAELYDGAEIKPAMVQNRCYARARWDQKVRGFCTDKGIGYQGFSLLTANGRELRSPEVGRIAAEHQCTVPQLVFAFSRQIGMLPLTGTSDENHMAQDLASREMILTDEQILAIETIAG